MASDGLYFVTNVVGGKGKPYRAVDRCCLCGRGKGPCPYDRVRLTSTVEIAILQVPRHHISEPNTSPTWGVREVLL